jgi:hypothetical protein
MLSFLLSNKGAAIKLLLTIAWQAGSLREWIMRTMGLLNLLSKKLYGKF